VSDLAARLREAISEVDALTDVVTKTSREVRRTHTATQDALAWTLIELARIKRELRELDADLTPVRPVAGIVEARANRSPAISGAQSLRPRDPKVAR
jgi:hypothetical protein